VIATLKRIRLPRGGIIHAFAGSREEAREYIKLGFKLGLGGAATWHRRCACTKYSRNCPWKPWYWKPMHRTWPPPCIPASATARNTCPRSAPRWPSAWA